MKDKIKVILRYNDEMKDKIKVILNKILQASSIIFKTLSSIVLTYFIMILPITAIRTGKIDEQTFPILLFCTLLAILTNGAIWTKGYLKKILMFVVLLVIGSIFVIRMMDHLGIASDYCIEDGDCEEGRVIHTQEYGSVTINKDNCLKYNWKWYDKQKYCKVLY